MKKRFILILFSMSVMLASYAQTTNTTTLDGQEAFRNLNSQGNMRTYDNRYDGIKGSIYVGGWEKGILVMEDKKTYSEIPLKYNAFENVLAVKKSDKDSIFINAANISSFTTPSLGKFMKEPDLAKNNPEEIFRFYQVLYEGKNVLFKKYKKELLKADYKGAYSSGRNYDEFVERQEYFIKKEDNTYMDAKMNEKTLFEIFPDRVKFIEEYIKSQKIKIKNEADFVNLLKELEKK